MSGVVGVFDVGAGVTVRGSVLRFFYMVLNETTCQLP